MLLKQWYRIIHVCIFCLLVPFMCSTISQSCRHRIPRAVHRSCVVWNLVSRWGDTGHYVFFLNGTANVSCPGFGELGDSLKAVVSTRSKGGTELTRHCSGVTSVQPKELSAPENQRSYHKPGTPSDLGTPSGRRSVSALLPASGHRQQTGASPAAILSLQKSRKSFHSKRF